MYLFTYLGHKWLYIYQTEECFKQMLERKVMDISCAQYTFYVNCAIFEVVKERGDYLYNFKPMYSK